jgi:hypothetical protein
MASLILRRLRRTAARSSARCSLGGTGRLNWRIWTTLPPGDTGSFPCWRRSTGKVTANQALHRMAAPPRSLAIRSHGGAAIGELIRSAKVRTAERDWPRKGAKCAKGIQAVTTPQIRRFALVGVFAPLALFRGYPDFLVSTFRARRSSNQTRQAMPVARHGCIRTRSARHACAFR